MVTVKPFKFVKKPVQIEAMLYDAMNTENILQWCPNAFLDTGSHGNETIFIETLEGDMQVDAGDYVIRGIKGEFYPCKPDIFTLTYDEVVE